MDEDFDKIVIKFVAFFLICLLFWAVWDWEMTRLFRLPALSYLESVGLVFICRQLFSR